MRRQTMAIAASAMSLAGCTVGPDYHRPEMAVPAHFEGAENAAQQAVAGASVDPERWWRAFGDPQLDRLVEAALAGNPDIAIAASRVREARLQEIVAGAQGKPTVDATGNVSHIEFSKNAGFSSLARLFQGGNGASGGGGSGSSSTGVALPGSGITTYALGFDASWELDLFGGARRGVEAATAQTQAAIWNKRDAAVTLAAEVADAYFAYRLDQAQLAILDQQIAHQRRRLQIQANIARAGLVPQVDVTRQNASITSLLAQRAPIVADQRVRAHALGILTGEAPETFTASLAKTASELGTVPVVPAGLPSALLRRRPDIRAAERQLAASTAQIGVAVADLYPKFNLTGVAQLISSALTNLISTDSLQATASAAGSFPLLDWGRRRATVNIRKEERDQAYLVYRRTVLTALQDVEDALTKIEADRARMTSLRSALRDSQTSLTSIAARYETGFVAEDSLLTAQNDVLTARQDLARTEAQLQQDTAALFKALGGGWQTEETATAVSATSSLETPGK